MCFTSYYRNCVLYGDLDYHCLLCDETLIDPEDINKHIRWENHRKKLKAQTFLPQFKNHGIYKIEQFYYCTHCNHVTFDFPSMKAHVAKSSHTESKNTKNPHPNNNNKLDAYYDDVENVIMNKTTKISNNSWNGITEGKCLLCNTQVSNIKKHVDEQAHVIRLIQAEIKLDGSTKCYRKINDTTVQCFICMKTFTPEDCEKHWPQHEIDINKINDSGNPKRITYDEYRELSNKEFDLGTLAKVDDEYYKVDLINRVVVCKLCNKAVKHTQNNLINHLCDKHHIIKIPKFHEKIREEIDKKYYWVEERDNGKKRHELAVFGNENFIKLDAGAKKAYCLLCDRFLCCAIDIFEEHVNGAIHTGHLEFKGLTKPKQTRKKQVGRFKNFTQYIVKMQYIPDIESVVVNYSLCIDKHSFLLLKRIKHGKHLRVSKCLVCERMFKWWQEKEHCETSTHKSYVLGAKVLCSDLAFIREVKSKLYHCGICNIVLPYWDSLERHLRDRGHKFSTTQKHITATIDNYEAQYGETPSHKEIEHSNVNDVIYANIMNELFTSGTGFRIYSINLDKDSKKNNN